MNMQIVAESKNVKMSPRKVQLVADAIRKQSVVKAMVVLQLSGKRSAVVLQKTLKSAVANAVHNAKLNQDMLIIDRIDVSGGIALKRFHPSTRGRVHPYKKRSTHVRIVLTDNQLKVENGKLKDTGNKKEVEKRVRK